MSIYRRIKHTLSKFSAISFNPERRRLGKIALGSILGGNIILSSRRSAGARKENTSNVKLAAMNGHDTSEEHLSFVKQLGLDYVVVWTSGERTTYENLLKLRQTIEAAGLKVANVGNGSTHNQDKITLNLPGREEKIEEYKNFLRVAGKAGYHTSIYAHMANGIWSTDRELSRGASARALDMEKARTVGWKTRSGTFYPDKPTHGRVYTEQEIWDNWEYFIKKAAPVAEEAGIRIGIHPDDPPVRVLGGIPRIFSSFEGYKQALEIADSPNVGLCLCVGCWLEGGKLMGKDVLETIRYFGERNKIFKVHFRNVEAPLPHFIESFLDNGYMDMYKVMKALVEVNNHCSVIDDHVPRMVGGRRTGDAFSIGYMRALLERANEEVKESDRLHFKGPYSS